jgi:hypothetical protein
MRAGDWPFGPETGTSGALLAFDLVFSVPPCLGGESCFAGGGRVRVGRRFCTDGGAGV